MAAAVIRNFNSQKKSFFQECIGFQHQLNIIQNVLNRVDPTNNLSPTSVKHNNKIDNLSSVSSDKLRVLSECLVEMLMHFLIEYGVKVNSYILLRVLV